MNERIEKGWTALVYRDELPTNQWRKSSYSGGGNDCVEVAAGATETGVRDSKDVGAGALWLAPQGWRALQAVARERG